jgi:hypothetical protein
MRYPIPLPGAGYLGICFQSAIFWLVSASLREFEARCGSGSDGCLIDAIGTAT